MRDGSDYGDSSDIGDSSENGDRGEDEAMTTRTGFVKLIDEKRLRARVRELAREIAGRYEDPVFVVVLHGARPFANALFESLDRAADSWAAMRVRSYQGTESTGRVEIVQDLEIDVRDREVVVLEDIVDTGRTVDFLDSELRARGAAAVDVWTLLSKPSRRLVDVDLLGVGFEIPDEFVIGFGLDLDGRYRDLPYIAIWDEEGEDREADASGRENASS